MTTTVSLKDQAIAAYRQEQRLEEQDQARREREKAERDAIAIAEAVQVLFKVNVVIEPGQPFFTVDDLTFGWSRTSYYAKLHLIQTCEICGEPIWSYPLGSLYELGRMLDQFATYNPHDHTPPRPEHQAPEPSDLDQLRNLLRRIVGLDETEED
jgi:hypothetical protein